MATIISMCDKPCDMEPNFYTKVDDLKVMLYDGSRQIVNGETVSVVDFLLGMTFDLAVAGNEELGSMKSLLNIFPVAYAFNACPPPVNCGLKNKISSISLTCDKQIWDFETGENLISSISTVRHGTTFSWDVADWITTINSGYDAKQPLFYLMSGEHLENLDFRITTEIQSIEEGDFTFTFRLDYAFGENPFIITFPTVRLK